ncbi:acyltransferase domain-containing protein, partial [Streptomyces viridochromogenes]|uniref:acyltransferase domain-containing protein n=1 Tax=Streptomyces viridochromogenes TaxID=1938 RepID=UPI0006C389B2
AGLAGQAGRLASYLHEHPDTSLTDIAHALATTRSHLPQRAVILATDHTHAITTLTALAQGEHTPDAITAQAAPVTGRQVWVFPGQGAQWAGMGADLLDTSPAFAQKMTEC